MSKPIPVDIIPSHVYLSSEDQATLFGAGFPMTIDAPLSQAGQHAYAETLQVFGKNKRSLAVRVLGPNWAHSFVELTPTEALMLGVDAPVAKTGDLSEAAACRLVGPAGEITLPQGIIIPRPHLVCSDVEADTMGLVNGRSVAVELLLEHAKSIEDVVVRVHPAFRLRLEVHQDLARDLWLTRPVHGRIRI